MANTGLAGWECVECGGKTDEQGECPCSRAARREAAGTNPAPAIALTTWWAWTSHGWEAIPATTDASDAFWGRVLA